ncbi:transcription factor Skn7p [[Candida] anglica]|uniref:Transcription factor n=1 Tax=[Candida] anglica TaxID=148631 RepID=A0ABP0EB24_9ASCO
MGNKTMKLEHSLGLEPTTAAPPATGSSNQSGSNDFVKKLFQMLQDDGYKEVVKWTTNGDSFVVLNTNEFTKEILPRHFKHSNFASFVRQLNKYDFHKVKIPNEEKQNYKYGDDAWEFKHPDFRINDRESLENIKRKGPTAKKGGGAGAGSGGAQGQYAGGGSGGAGSGGNGDFGSSTQLANINEELNALRTENKTLFHELNVMQTKYKAVVENLVTLKNFDERYYNSMRMLVNCLAQAGIKLPPLDFPNPNLMNLQQPPPPPHLTSLHQRAHSYSSSVNHVPTPIGVGSPALTLGRPFDPPFNSIMSQTQATPPGTGTATGTSTATGPPPPPPAGVGMMPLPIRGSGPGSGPGPVPGPVPVPVPGQGQGSVRPTGSFDSLSVARGSPQLNAAMRSPATLGKGTLDGTNTPVTQASGVGTSVAPSGPGGSGSGAVSVSPVDHAQITTTNLPNPKFHVLLVEDDNVCIQLCRKFLVKYGCQVTVATDGLNAISTVEHTKYDLVLMDIVMPNLDGATATSVIRSFDTKTPIIAMTGNIEEYDLVTYLQNGMSDILAKPFTKDDLYSILSKHLLTPSTAEGTTSGGDPLQAAVQPPQTNLVHSSDTPGSDPSISTKKQRLQ